MEEHSNLESRQIILAPSQFDSVLWSVDKWYIPDHLLMGHRYLAIIKLLTFHKFLKYVKPNACIISFKD